jgi:hypothetical protein
MSNPKLTDSQKSIIHNCLLDLRDSSSLKNPSFLPLALDSLLATQGFGTEMSGIYISTDDDQDNIPEYLQEGIAFEFMGNHVSLSFEDGIACIINWCEENVQKNCEKTIEKIQKLKEKHFNYGSRFEK